MRFVALSVTLCNQAKFRNNSSYPEKNVTRVLYFHVTINTEILKSSSPEDEKI